MKIYPDNLKYAVWLAFALALSAIVGYFAGSRADLPAVNTLKSGEEPPDTISQNGAIYDRRFYEDPEPDYPVVTYRIGAAAMEYLTETGEWWTFERDWNQSLDQPAPPFCYWKAPRETEEAAR